MTNSCGRNVECAQVARLAVYFVLLLGTQAAAQQSAARSSSQTTLVKASRLLDPRTGNILAPAAVLIEGEKIKQIGKPSQITVPSGTKIIDLGSATLLPGLIDSQRIFVRSLKSGLATECSGFPGMIAIANERRDDRIDDVSSHQTTQCRQVLIHRRCRAGKVKGETNPSRR